MAEKAAKRPEYDSDSSSTGSVNKDDLTSSSSSDVDSSAPELQDEEPWTSPKHENACFEYTGKGGFSEELIREVSQKSMLEAYEWFVDEEVLQFIVEETNRYAMYKLEGNWEPLTVLELRKVLALLVWMLIVVPCSRADIMWSKDPYLQKTLPKQVMPDGERFQKILRMLHFCNNEHLQSQVDKAWFKVQRLTEMMVARFQKAFTPELDMVVDEKVLMPHKHFRILRIAAPNSYTWNTKLVTGGESEFHAVLKQHIIQLVTPAAYCGRVVFTTKAHSSVGLANDLLSHGTNSVGLLHPRKGGAPVSLVKKKVTKNKVVSALENSNGVRVMKCSTGGEKYLFLTTVHDPGDMQEKTDRKGKVKRLPRVLVNYNKVMETIEEADEMKPPVLQEDEQGRPGLKWYQRYGLELVVGYSVINAYLLYKAANQDNEQHNTLQRDFNLCLVKEMLNKCDVEIAPVPITENIAEDHSSSEKSYNSFSFDSDEAMPSGQEYKSDGHCSSD